MGNWKLIMIVIVIFIIAICATASTWTSWVNTSFRVVGDLNNNTFDAIVSTIISSKGILGIAYNERLDSGDKVLIFYIFCRKWNKNKFIQKFKTIPNVEVS